jgi:hypothetical protein
MDRNCSRLELRKSNCTSVPAEAYFAFIMPIYFKTSVADLLFWLVISSLHQRHRRLEHTKGYQQE